MPRRSKAAIVHDILDTLLRNGGSMNLTRLSQEANLAYNRLLAIVEDLAERGALKIVEEGQNKTVYITEKGVELAGELRRLRRLLSDFNIEL